MNWLNWNYGLDFFTVRWREKRLVSTGANRWRQWGLTPLKMTPFAVYRPFSFVFLRFSWFFLVLGWLRPWNQMIWIERRLISFNFGLNSFIKKQSKRKSRWVDPSRNKRNQPSIEFQWRWIFSDHSSSHLVIPCDLINQFIKLLLLHPPALNSNFHLLPLWFIHLDTQTFCFTQDTRCQLFFCFKPRRK